MKSIVTLAFFCFWFFQIAAQIPNPTANFHFNGDVIDAVSGLAFDTSKAASQFIAAPGGRGSAIQFTGGSGLELSPAPFAAMDTGDHTIAFWFRNDGSLWPTETVFTGPGYSFRYNGFFDQLEFRFAPSRDSATLIFSVTPADKVWTHLVISIDRDDSMRYYQNGILRAQKKISHYSHFNLGGTGGGTLRVGKKDVSLDELYFFDQALTAQEALDLYRSRITSIPVQHQEDISIYPNPAFSKVFFTQKIPPKSSYQILDMQGRTISNGFVEGESISLEGILSGRYVIALEEKGKPVYLPLLIQK
ncbi:MAG: LamG-like jellyroll fold domain-containing protein [Bacteroidia bacterium]